MCLNLPGHSQNPCKLTWSNQITDKKHTETLLASNKHAKVLKSGNQTGNAVRDALVEYIFQLGRQLYGVQLQFWTRISLKMCTKGQIKKNHLKEAHFPPKLQILSLLHLLETPSSRKSSKLPRNFFGTSSKLLETPRNFLGTPRPQICSSVAQVAHFGRYWLRFAFWEFFLRILMDLGRCAAVCL